MSKKLTIAICGVGTALCVLTGCSADTAEQLEDLSSYSQDVELLGLSGFDTDAANKVLPPGFESQSQFDTYNSLMGEIVQKYQTQAQAATDAANAEIKTVLDQVLGSQYVELKTEYSGLYDQYQSLVQGFYADENYIALKDELNAKISELSSLTRGSAEYQEKLAEINAVWGQISVLAGEVNSKIALLNTRAMEITREAQKLINANIDEINTLIEPIVAKYKVDIEAIQSLFLQEVKLLQETLGISISQPISRPYKPAGRK